MYKQRLMKNDNEITDSRQCAVARSREEGKASSPSFSYSLILLLATAATLFPSFISPTND